MDPRETPPAPSGAAPASAAGSALAERLRPLALDALVFLPLGAAYLALKAYGWWPAVGDENIYFYDAALMLEGKLPYRDFFFAHPPLHLLPAWLLFTLLGRASFTAGKLIPTLATLLAGAAIFVAARRAFGRVAAAGAMVAFFFAHDLLRASSHYTGICESLALMSVGLAFALAGRPRASGVAYALGAATGFYVFPGALMAATLLALRDPRTLRPFALGFAIPFGVVNLACLAVGGDAFVEAVYRYHLAKPGGEAEGLAGALPNLLFHNFYLLAGPLFALVPAVSEAWAGRRAARGDGAAEAARPGEKRRRRRRGGEDDGDGPGLFARLRALLSHPRLGPFCFLVAYTGGYLFFLSLLSRVFHFYFLLLFPSAAMLAGYALAWTAGALVQTVAARAEVVRPAAAAAAAVARGAGRWLPAPGANLAAVVVLAALYVGGFFLYPWFETRIGYFARQQGEWSTYDRPRPAVDVPGVDALVGELFWSPNRKVGDRYTSVLYYLWHESRVFTTAREMADVLAAVARPGETVFGDSTSTPLVALWSGVPIALDEVDTNAMRFRSGITPPQEVLERLRATWATEGPGRFTFVLAQPGRGFIGIEAFRHFLEQEFEVVRRFPTRYYGTYVLYARKGRGEEARAEATRRFGAEARPRGGAGGAAGGD